MSYVITLAVYFFNLINSILYREFKIFILIFIVLIWGLMGGNYQNPDIYAYNLSYNSLDLNSFEIGYWILEIIFNGLGVSYQTFRMILCGFGILLINNTVKEVTTRKSLYYLLYFIYPFFLDVVQVRNFLAMSLFIYGLRYLISNEKFNNFKYILTILIAASIQNTALVYLPIILLIRKKKTNIFKFFMIEIVLLIVIFFSNHNIVNILSDFIIDNFGHYDDRISAYAYRQTNWGFLLYWLIQFLNFGLVYYCNNFFKKNISLYKKKGYSDLHLDRKKKYLKLILWINIYSFIFLPLYVFQSTFSRLMRNIVPLNIMAFSIIGEVVSYRDIRKFGIVFIFFLYQIFIFYFEIYALYYESIVEAIFRYNNFFPF